jgi:Hemerythrin HHE cation binding domain
MPKTVPYEDAVDLLDADHKAVKQMFIDYDSLREGGASPDVRQAVAQRICAALMVHMRIEEDIFYPKVREAIDDDELMDGALDEHADAKAVIANLVEMDAADNAFDATVKQLGKLIDQHVLEEREEIFLMARNAALDLRALAVPLYHRKQELENKVRVSAEVAK